MEKADNLRKSLSQFKQVQLQRLQDPKFTEGDISQLVECIKNLNNIDTNLLKIDLFQEIHSNDISRIDEIEDYKEKTIEEILYESIEESFPKTAKIISTLKYILPKYYKDLLIFAFERNEFKDVSYLLPAVWLKSTGKKSFENTLRQEFWTKLLKDEEKHRAENSWLFLEDITANVARLRGQNKTQAVIQRLKEDSSLEIMEKQSWNNFTQEIFYSQEGALFVEIAEKVFKESGNLKGSLKILEDGFFQGYTIQILKERIMLYSIASLMIYKIGIFTIELEDLQVSKESSLIGFLFDTVIKQKPSTLPKLKSELKSIYVLYSTEEHLVKLFQEYLLSLDTRSFYMALTLDQKSVERTDQLLIENDYVVFGIVTKYIEDNCYFEHYEFINKLVKLLKSSLTLDIRLKLMEGIEKIELQAECVQLLFNFHINHKFEYLNDFEELDKLAQSRERGLEILSQIVTNFNRSQIRSQNVTLKNKPIDLKNVRSVLNVLLHLQEHVMRKCIDVQLVYQVFIKKLLEFGNYKDVQNLIDREKLLSTINQEIFEMIVLEAISNILDNLPNLAALDSTVSQKIKKCFDLIPWDSDAKDAEESLYQACLILQKTDLKNSYSPSKIRSCNKKIELLYELARGPTKDVSFLDLYSLLKASEYKTTEGDTEFIEFMASFMDTYLENNERKKVKDLVDYLTENNYAKISEVLIKILKNKTAAIKSDEKKYYTRVGILKCDNGQLLSNYLNDPNLPYLKDFEKDVINDHPESMKVVLVKFDLFTSDFYEKKNDFETSWKVKKLFVDTIKKIDNNRWKGELSLFFSNLTINHERAFQFLLQAPGITINTVDAIVESLMKSGFFNVKVFSEFLLNYVIKDLMKYNGGQGDHYTKFGTAADFERVIQKYKSIINYSKDFISFGTLVESKDQAKFLFEENFRQDLISKLIVSTHSEPKIVEKAEKYGLNANSINMKLFESKFISLKERDYKVTIEEMKQILGKISIQTPEEKQNFMTAVWDMFKHAPSLNYFPALSEIIGDKLPGSLNEINLNYLKALIGIDFAEEFREFFSLNTLLKDEHKDTRFDKVVNQERFRDLISQYVKESNVFILSKSLPVLIPKSVTSNEVHILLLKKLLCKQNVAWNVTNLERLQQGKIDEDPDLKMFIDRIDMLLNHLDYTSLAKLLKELVYVNMDAKSLSSKEEIPLLKFTKLALGYQQFFGDKIRKKLTDMKPKVEESVVSATEEDLNTGSVVGVKIKLLNQLSNLYGNSITQVLSLKDFWAIRNPNQLSNFIFGLFKNEVISSSMLVVLIKELGKDAFTKGYLKNELRIKLEETSIEISDRLWDIWDTAIIFREVTSKNRAHKLNFQVKFEVIEDKNKDEFEGLIRFLQKTHELLILDEDFANAIKGSLAEVLVSMVIENTNYSFRLKLQLIHLAFKYLPQISIVNQGVSRDYILEVFALLDRAFSEFETAMQFDKTLLNILLAENPNVHLVQLFDSLVFAPKSKPFYQNLVLRDICLRFPSEELILHCLGNIINFNAHEDPDMLFDLFFVRRTKAARVEREVSAKNLFTLILEDMAYKMNKQKVEESFKNMIVYILPDSRESHLIYKYLIYKGKINLLKKTEHYDYCLKFACEIFRSQKNPEDFDPFSFDDAVDYDSDIHEICMHELWAGKTLEHVLLKNVISLIEGESFIEAARIVNEYCKESRHDKDHIPINKTFESLKAFVETIITEKKNEYAKFDQVLQVCYNKIKKL